MTTISDQAQEIELLTREDNPEAVKGLAFMLLAKNRALAEEYPRERRAFEPDPGDIEDFGLEGVNRAIHNQQTYGVSSHCALYFESDQIEMLGPDFCEYIGQADVIGPAVLEALGAASEAVSVLGPVGEWSEQEIDEAFKVAPELVSALAACELHHMIVRASFSSQLRQDKDGHSFRDMGTVAELVTWAVCDRGPEAVRELIERATW